MIIVCCFLKILLTLDEIELGVNNLGMQLMGKRVYGWTFLSFLKVSFLWGGGGGGGGGWWELLCNSAKRSIHFSIYS